MSPTTDDWWFTHPDADSRCPHCGKLEISTVCSDNRTAAERLYDRFDGDYTGDTDSDYDEDDD